MHKYGSNTKSDACNNDPLFCEIFDSHLGQGMGSPAHYACYRKKKVGVESMKKWLLKN
jgi:hypothetical protein